MCSVPLTPSGESLDAKAALDRGFDRLAGWMRKAESVWDKHAESGEMTLIGRWNYHGALGKQFPISSLRIVYAKGGTLPAACLVRGPSYAIDHKLYWFTPADLAEARYLSAVLHSETARFRAAAYQSRGQFGARDFDKVMFNLPIPRFDAKIALHCDLATAAEEAEKVAAAVSLPEGVKFQRARRMVRDALASARVSARTDALVAKLLDGA